MELTSKIQKNPEKYLLEDTKYGVFYLEDDLLEMARVGAVPNSKYEIHIEGGEGYIPHMHICSKTRNNIVLRLCLLSNEYFREKDDLKNTLNTEQRKALEKFMNKMFSEEFNMNNWQHLCLVWNQYNPSHKIENIKSLKQPNYTTINERKTN